VTQITRATIVDGRYRIISQLGAGGMGEAFRAWDQEAGVPVVLKRPLPIYASRADVLERFDREINRLRDLPHGNIVPIVGHGYDEFGVPFLAMRFLPGGSLADRSRPQPATRLHNWLPGVAEALDFAHACGVLHRDVKPGNIFFDAKGVAYLGDFGIAKVIEDEVQPQGEEALTGTGENLGTSAYMAPEFNRQPRILTGAYDQYALAITVYEMVCGRRPFAGDGGQLILAHATQAPPDIRTIYPDAPASFCEAVARALAKKPESRFISCTAFAEAALHEIHVSANDETTFRFMCPSCRKLVKVPEQFGGRDGRCTQCGVRLRVSDNLDALWLRDEDQAATAVPARDRGDRTVLTQVGGTGSTQPGGLDDRTVLTAIAPATPVAASRRPALPGAIVGLSVLVLAVAVAVGVWMGGRRWALVNARTKKNWDAVLSMNPGDTAALVQRALKSLGKTPPQIEAAFADLDEARRLKAPGEDVKDAISRAHALRARRDAEEGKLEAAEKDLAVAEQMSVSHEWREPAREALAVAWIAEARAAIAGRDAARAGRAIARADALGADAATSRELQVHSLMLGADALESKGARDGALDRVFAAIAVDDRLTLRLLEQSDHPSLRTAALVRYYRRSFDAAFDQPDWERSIGAIVAAQRVEPRSWEWLTEAIVANPEVVTTMPADALASLPKTTLAALPIASLGELPSLRNSIGMRLRFIQRGSFVMGNVDDDAASPAHPVTISDGFFLGTCEVTNAEWQRVMGDVPSRWASPLDPVERVSWTEAAEFCRRLSALPGEVVHGRVYRLPSEAEWEFACRAGTTTRYSFGDGRDVQSAFEHGWFVNNSGQHVFSPEAIRQSEGQDAYITALGTNGCRTRAVGEKRANPWGLHDMHGNVWEWCQDWYSKYTDGPATDPTGPPTGTSRVFRGGCWYFEIQFAGSAARIGGKESFRRDDLGFRVAFTPTEPRLGASASSSQRSGAMERQQRPFIER